MPDSLYFSYVSSPFCDVLCDDVNIRWNINQSATSTKPALTPVKTETLVQAIPFVEISNGLLLLIIDLNSAGIC